MIKAIVCDMDGTLLDNQKRISKQDEEILIGLQEKGYKLILCSGRSYSRMVDYAKQLRMDEFDGYLIDINGTSIIDYKTMTIDYDGGMDKNDVLFFMDLAKDVEYEVQCSNYGKIQTYLSPTLYEKKKTYRKLHQVTQETPWNSGVNVVFAPLRADYPENSLIHSEDDIPLRCNKLAITSVFEGIDTVFETITTKEALKKYNITRTNPYYIEITRKSVSKGIGLTKLLNRLNIKPTEIIVFGDGENDVSMFLEGSISVGMENAAEYVKEKAKHTTLDNNSSGVSTFLKEYLNYD